MRTDQSDLPMWRALQRNPVAEILLSQEILARSELIDPLLGGFDIRTSMLEAADPIPEELARARHVLIVEVRRGDARSRERFRKLMAASQASHVIAAVPDLSVDDARDLLRMGASDVVSLPLRSDEIEAALGRIRIDIDAGGGEEPKGRIVSVIKSAGGVGATALLTQLACSHARQSAKAGDETCLLDLDIQFGNAALYLGSLPKLGMRDLIEAGARADGALLRATTSQHSSGLHYVAAPPEMLPLDSVDPDQIIGILDIATREYETVFVDLPTNWTNWSLSTLARSHLILLVTELTVASLHQARRQLDLIQEQNMAAIPLRIVMNRVEKKLFRSIDLKDGARALRREIAYTIADDPQVVGAALDQGVLLTEIRSRSKISRDLEAMLHGISATLAEAPNCVAG